MIHKIGFIVVLTLGVRAIPPAPEDLGWLNDMDRVVWRDSKIADLDPYHMWSTFGTESEFNGSAVNKRTKASGCGQLMPKTVKTLGLTPEETTDCRENMSASIRWMEKGVKEINTKDPQKLSQWYYCGINYYGKIIFDKDLKITELCGLTYSRKVIKRMTEFKKKNIFKKHESKNV